MSRKYRTALLLLICVLILIPVLAVAGISTTKHNLSVSGPGPIRAVSETQICIFCHTPHNAHPSGPAWNRAPSAAASYTNYWSTTLKAYASRAEAPPVDGFSKLCLGCHDGTIALGAVISRQQDIQMVTIAGVVDPTGKLLPGAAGHMTADFSGHHPISVAFNQALASKRNADPFLMPLKWPITDPDVKLYPTQSGYGVQCTSCHEPHGAKGGVGAPPFWQKATYDDVCLACHEF